MPLDEESDGAHAFAPSTPIAQCAQMVILAIRVRVV